MISTVYRVSVSLPVPGERAPDGRAVDGYLDDSELHSIAVRHGAGAIESVACPACAMCSCETDSLATARTIEAKWISQLRRQGLPESYLES